MDGSGDSSVSASICKREYESRRVSRVGPKDTIHQGLGDLMARGCSAEAGRASQTRPHRRRELRRDVVVI